MKTDEVSPTPLRVQARNSCEVLYKHCKRQYNKQDIKNRKDPKEGAQTPG